MPNDGWFWFLIRVACAVAVMSLCILWLDKAPELWYQQGLWARVGDLSLMVVSAGIAYFVVLMALGIRPHQLLLRQVD